MALKRAVWVIFRSLKDIQSGREAKRAVLSRSTSRRQRRVDRLDGRLTVQEPDLRHPEARVLLQLPNVCIIPTLVRLDLLLPVPGRSAVTPPIRRGLSRYVAQLTNP